MDIIKLGVGDKATQDLESTVKSGQVKNLCLDESILLQLKIMNLHLSVITNLEINEDDIEAQK